MQQGLTELIVERWCGRLLHFTGHRAGNAPFAAALAIGCASSLESYSWLFVLCIFSRGVVPVEEKRQHRKEKKQDRSLTILHGDVPLSGLKAAKAAAVQARRRTNETRAKFPLKLQMTDFILSLTVKKVFNY